MNEDPQGTKHGYIHKAIPFLLLCVFFFFSFSSMLKKSVTVDEFAHLPAGYSYLKTGEFHVYRFNPPLIKMLAAAPLLTRDVDFVKDDYFLEGNHWGVGHTFMRRNAGDYQEIFTYGRTVIILIGLAGGLLVFFWARELFGWGAGCMALFFYAFSPNIIAHSRLVTTDVGAAVFMLAALYSFSRWMKKKTWSRTVATGVFLGLAHLTKFTAAALYLIIIPFFLLRHAQKGTTKNDLLKLIAIVGISVFTINAGYLFNGSFTPLGQFDFKDPLMISVQSLLPSFLPVPLPSDYILGFDNVRSATNAFKFQFFMGEISTTTGWWYYHPTAFMLKVPLAFIATLVLLVILRINKRLPKLSDDELLMLLTIVVYTTAFIVVIKESSHFRYMLPLLPLLHILASRLTLVKMAPRFRTALIGAILTTYAVASINIYPHYISFFNSLAKGPKNGYNYLIDSNIDMGQDLILLKQYMDEKGLDSIKLAYFGRVDPVIYGIDYDLLEQEDQGVTAAVSVNYYQGFPYFLFKGEKRYESPLSYYKFLHRYPISDRVGYSILVFEIPP